MGGVCMGSDIIDVAIVGAGPYGLSLATHLKAEGVPFRIFGRPMQFWCDLPAGMFLKSLAFASHTSHHRDYVAYAGKSVCVIGSGQSAFEAARLLFEAGVRPQSANPKSVSPTRCRDTAVGGSRFADLRVA